MPNWRKVILSGSTASLNSLTVTNGITGSLFGTASYASNGGVTQIVAGTNVSITPTTGLGAVTINASVTFGQGTNTTASFSNTASWVFNHNLSTQYPVIQVYDIDYNQIVPQSITLTNPNTTTITFPGNESGYAVASVGGVGVSAATASYVLNAVSSSYATTSSYNFNSISASFAATASYINPLTQSINLRGQLNITPVSASSTAGIVVSGSGTVGGSDYVDFIKVTNTAAGATNPNTSFRKNSTGGIEVINSSYTSTLLTLNDNGNMTLSGSITMPNRPAFRVIGTGGSIAATTIISGSAVTVDFNQGGYYSTTTGKFTAPIAGLYQVNTVCRTAANNNSGINQIIVRKQLSGGGALTTQIMLEWAANTSVNHMGGSSIVNLAVGDTLWVEVTAGTISFDGNDNFSAAYIG